MRLTIACMFFSCCAVLSCSAQSAPAGFHEELIAELPPGAELGDSTNSAHHLAWVEKRDEQSVVRLDGKQQGGAYDEVKHLEFSVVS